MTIASSAQPQSAIQLKNYQLAALARLRLFLDEARLDFNPARAFEKIVLEATGFTTPYRPLPGLAEVPSVCLRLPTGGGKTILGAASVAVAAESYCDTTSPLVLWLVPSITIGAQTRKALADPHHPYRLALADRFEGRVRVFEIADFENIRPQDLSQNCCVVIATMQTLSVENRDGRRVYAHNENLEPHFTATARAVPGLQTIEEGKPGAGTARFSFANLLKVHRPIVIIDEVQNFATKLSAEVKERIDPSVVIELTATPPKNSNVLFRVSASELKEDDMIKLPIVLAEHLTQWQDTVSQAVATRKRLAALATEEPQYIRPLLLIQCENASRSSDWQAVKQYLIESEHMAESEIAVQTGTTRELDSIDLFSPDCQVTTILTVQALVEGWDCSFAYVLCSTANIGNAKDIEQLLGRVLRMPYATKRNQPELNKAYAHVVSKRFGETALKLQDALIDMGFERDETLSAIVGEQGDFFPLEPFRQPLIQTMTARPDLSSLTDDQRSKITITEEEGEFRLVAVAPLPERVATQLRELAPAAVQLDLAHRIALHNLEWSPSPSEQGLLFSVPQLAVELGATFRLFDPSVLEEDFELDLNEYPADLAGFSLSDVTRRSSLDIEGRRIVISPLGALDQLVLPGSELTPNSLISWLNRKLRMDRLTYAQLDSWVRAAIQGLLQSGVEIEALYLGKFLLVRKLSELLRIADASGRKKAYQHALLHARTPKSEFSFSFPADYSAHWLCPGTYRFAKHFYPRPGELKADGDEFKCAQEIDRLEEIEFWVRNLAPPPVSRSDTSFWLPAAGRRFYPDFVAKLRDDRILVVEFKGRVDEKADEDRDLGFLWAERSEGQALFVMAFERDERGRTIREQLKAAIATLPVR
jgi:type III restriction enzyme